MIQLIRGFKDILPEEAIVWQTIEKTAVSLFEEFGFTEIRIPVMEQTDLFKRSIGEDTDIVEKEMYTFPDRKGTMLTLRPEATASIVRSYIQHKMHAADPVRKFYMIGPMFRRERPQKGRYRQFYQIDAEIFGVESAYADVILIVMLVELLKRLNVKDTKVHVNTLGCPDCRPDYREALISYLNSMDMAEDRLCEDCNRRKSRNPLRVLDCKVPSCRETVKNAPELINFLCKTCRAHFAVLTESLAEQGIEYIVDKRLVRGLDYYTRTIFEIQTEALGAQSAVAGGGRYDGLIDLLDGPNMPATGFAVGLDRLAEIVAQTLDISPKTPKIYVAALGEECRKTAFSWIISLGKAGVYTEMDFTDRSLKSHMKRADRLNAEYVLILGENELKDGTAALRNMKTREQIDIPVGDAVSALCNAVSGIS